MPPPNRRPPSGPRSDIQVRGFYAGDTDPIPSLDKSDLTTAIADAQVGAGVQVTVNNSLYGIIAVGRVTSLGNVEVVLNNASGGPIAEPVAGWDLTITVTL